MKKSVKTTKKVAKKAVKRVKKPVSPCKKKKKAPLFAYKDVKWGELVGNEKVYKLHQGQSAVLRSTTRFTAAVAGTGGGKTAIGPLWLMRRIKALVDAGVTEKFIGMVVAPTYKILSRATVPTLVEVFRGTEFEGRFLESKGQYILPAGLGILYLLSADSPNGLEGGQLNLGAWLDEAGQMSYQAWLALCRRTGKNEAPILITTTPYLANWLKTAFMDLAFKGDKDYTVVTWASIKNPAYPVSEYERARKTMRKSEFEMTYNGIISSPEGMVYPEFHTCIVDNIDEKEGVRVGGIDFGWRAPFCALSGVLVVEDGKDILYIYKERYVTHCGLAIHAMHLDKSTRWYADPSEPEMIEDLRKRGFKVQKAKNPIKAGISAVNARILSGRLKVSSTCVNLIMEAGLYQYPDSAKDKDDQDKNIIDEKPLEGADHALDALRYICMSLPQAGRKLNNARKVYIRSY